MPTSTPGRTATIPGALVVAGQLAIAAVWAYEGLIAKVAAQRSDELAIVASLPGLPDGYVRGVVIMLGTYELLLALWVLIGRAPRAAAALQTLTLVVFNTGGLIFGGGEIAEPAHLLISNASLLVLVWTVALARSSLDRR